MIKMDVNIARLKIALSPARILKYGSRGMEGTVISDFWKVIRLYVKTNMFIIILAKAYIYAPPLTGRNHWPHEVIPRDVDRRPDIAQLFKAKRSTGHASALQSIILSCDWLFLTALIGLFSTALIGFFSQISALVSTRQI